MVERLFIAGVDVFRINMSHSTHDGSKTLYNTVRACAARHRHPIGILADLQGPKFRVGNFDAGPRQRSRPAQSSSSTATKHSAPRNASTCLTARFSRRLSPAHTLVLDDGKLRMRVIDASPVQIKAEVMTVRHAREPQGHFDARYAPADQSADRERPGRPGRTR